MNPPKAKTIHIKKFQDGRVTPREYHAANAFPIGAKCKICKSPPMIQICSFGEEKECWKLDPGLRVLASVNPEKYATMLVELKSGRYLRLGVVYACDSCTPAAERAAAQHPSWVWCRIDRAPDPVKLVVGPTSWPTNS